MEKSSIKCMFFLLFVCVTVISHSNAAPGDGETEDEHEFNYEMEGERGPKNWGKLKPEWKMCGRGKMQSPIDLLNKRVRIVSHLGRLKRDYRPSNATLKNRGHDMMLRFEDGAGRIHVKGRPYTLRQIHWHSPSEHTINGKRFALELHMVHESKNGRFAVVTILYKIGRPDTFLQSLENGLEEVSDKHEAEKNIGIIDPKKIKFGSRKYYRYIGSLTTPPCTQNVVWTVLKKVRTVTREQVRLLRVSVHDDSNSNARPIQRRNKRRVYLYRPRYH
ncbi:PREDICTED: alpha carbonic anhydrase 7-like [Tarenaya hassleriana]|uniref:alpha carbonic anhydrase 7-like n=1 Tax=Tarenaya hassleriana TaxID=28532 RepID=UPI00053C45EC|nr:PREDICTED: alpha carbonic anhydrase 7-like [Tarenaya hassleriana]